ncbi:putative inactive cadmium/zinc-transporting ATPase HMA3 [Prosopis cineraria]|uniref:putative inactive cadmium/zinc-transporting ATPase HMA3 n=1 Tax=Prosopis cineraria TaxID=364024 RepID=UPI00240F5CCA|nr:putative inactive cadmium/zinc-transporting ATPase HMA3 [Prosopis cineraria]
MAKGLKKSNFEVLGMCCNSEVALIEKILKGLLGVKDISIMFPTRTVTVIHDLDLISESQITDALNMARLEASLRPEGKTKHEKKSPAPSTLACGLLLALSFLKCAYQPLEYLAIGAVLIGSPRVLLRGIASIRNLSLDINILVLLAVFGTLALGDFWEAAIITFLFSIAQWLETVASYKAMAAMSYLTNMTPQRAIIAETGEHVDVNEVIINTVLAVKAGDSIPLDGIVVEGKCEADEKMLTGESFPVSKELGSTVWAGTINLNGYISVRTTALAKDTAVARMTKLVEEAHARKSRAQRFIDTCAKYYVPGVFLISVGVAVIPLALRVPNIKYWCHMAIVVLVSACPCALILSTPVTIFCALTKAATSGLLLKGGDYVEALAGIKILAFDKTGTLTKGEFTVTDFSAVGDDISIQLLLYWVSSIESKSSHPMAAALLEYGRLHRIKPIPENVEEFQNFPGEGVYGKIDGEDVYIGNRKICERAGCESEFLSKEQRNGYICCGTTLVGVFSLSDTCRTGALEAIEKLKSLGVKSAMLTGDGTHAATLVQTQLNHALDMVHAELLPHEKAAIIENFKKEGLTAMIGDGINDAPALATADVGISMGISGSALAVETGHAILMSNDIRKIPEAIDLARRTFRKLVQNAVFSIVTKGLILALALAGYPLVWLAVLTDVGTCLLVILNSMLLLNEKKHNNKIKPNKPKYGLFVTDKNEPLLEKQTDCSEGCYSNVSRKVCCSDYGPSNLSLLEEGHCGKLVSEDIGMLETCNDGDGCCSEVRFEEESSCRTQSGSNCCQMKYTEAKCGSGKCGSRQCCEQSRKTCCVDRVYIPEIVIE